ncbi:MAG: PIN domain-containing protein [Candidatus Diapherotrites archaeon]
MDGIRPLGEFAFQFLNNCIKHNCKIIYAEPVLFELRLFPKEFVEEMFSYFKDILIEAPATTKQTIEAKQIAEKRDLPFNDVFHAVIARDNKALMITRDKQFEELSDIVESKKPEEVIFD